MKIKDPIAFVPGAKRGLGLAPVYELLARGASQVYAGVRDPASSKLPSVIAVKFGATRSANVAAAAKYRDGSVRMNNAGLAKVVSDLDPAPIDTGRAISDTSFLAPIRMSEAHTPLATNDGAIVNGPPVELAATVTGAASLSCCPPVKEIKKRSNTMLKLTQKFILMLPLSFSLGILPSSAYALGASGTNADYGAVVSTDFAGRQISVTAATKWVNVTNGETVRFTANGKNFTWHFDTFDQTSFDLSAIAPKDVYVKGVRIYVASRPAYLGL